MLVRLLLLALLAAVLGADVPWAAADENNSQRGLPIRDGLVLWLDAGDRSTLTCSQSARVLRWADKSAAANHAVAESEQAGPLLGESSTGQPAVVFGGKEFLNLGRSESLAFGPGEPFTVIVLGRVNKEHFGTFLAKGGGQAGQRAYQFYAAPRRLGAVCYGAMHETPRQGDLRLAAQVCDGKLCRLYADGAMVLQFAAGEGNSDCDVLLGARRETADNRNVYYPLHGQIGELLVYRRALGDDELRRVYRYLEQRHQIELGALPSTARELVERVLDRATEAALPPQLPAIAEALWQHGEEAAALLGDELGRSPVADMAIAEVVWKLAEANKLSPSFAAVAGRLLGSADPFAGGLAEWAISMKVGGENSGQDVVWPGPDSPPWFSQWAGLPWEAQLEADYVRQAVNLAIHRDGRKLLGQIQQIVARLERMEGEYAASAAAAQCRAEACRQIAAIERQMAQIVEEQAGRPEALARLRGAYLDARKIARGVVLANPAVDFQQILFAKQHAPHTVRNITRSYAWKHKPGGDVFRLAELARGDQAEPLVGGRLGPGFVWGVDLWWDADRIVFGFAKHASWPPGVDTTNATIEGRNVLHLRRQFEPIHLFELTLADGSLRQLTNDRYWSDFEPTYCPGGEIVFASDRCGRSAECGNDTFDHTNPILYRLSADRRRIEKLTDAKDIDRYPHCLDDGRIAYTHWEYQERHFMEVHAVWTVRPDGTMADALFKQHMSAPYGLRDTRSIPGSAKLVSVATGHHTFAYGPVVIVDPARGLNSAAGLHIVTPGVVPQEGPMDGRPVAEGGIVDRGGLYQHPWALSEKCFLVSYAYPRPGARAPAGVDSNGFGIYLIDVYGNRELIYRDPILSSVNPIPLRKRPRPPLVSALAAQAAASGSQTQAEVADGPPSATCYLADVYAGMPGVPRGTIKYLRVAQHVPWPFDPVHGQMDYIPGDAGKRQIAFQSWSPVRVLGTVPVEEDGSAFFRVPADVAVYFQALDERLMEVRRMRSLVAFKAGEVRGCRGCHESQAVAPPPRQAVPRAVYRRQQPPMPTPPPWGSERLLGYEWMVQPILDRHCVRCHAGDKPDGHLDFSAALGADGLLQSYRTMFGIGPQQQPGQVLIECADRFSGAEVSRPYQFGSPRSTLVRVLLDDPLHCDEVALDPVEWETLVTWVDANAPYYDAFLNKRLAEGGPAVRNVQPCLAPASPIELEPPIQPVPTAAVQN